jgi:hypothetical protein
VKVTKSDDLVTGIAGAVLWGRCWTGWGWSARRIAGICDRSGAKEAQVTAEVPDTSGTNLSGADLHGANLSGAWLGTLDRSSGFDPWPMAMRALRFRMAYGGRTAGRR